MTILDKIVATKKQEIAEAKGRTSVIRLEESELFTRSCYSLSDFIKSPQRNGIIAEFKRASPSKGLINGTAKASEVADAYATHRASAISVLTDEQYFGGSREDLYAVRSAVHVPVLRKDFMLDPYQILEAKSCGA